MDCDAVTAGDVELCDDPEYVATVTAVDAWRAELDALPVGDDDAPQP